jgi:hypothetical protein
MYRETAAPPLRSELQRSHALELANAVRSERAAVKREVKAGDRWVVDLILDPPENLCSMKVRKLLLAVRQVGPVRAGKILRAANVAPSKTLAGLSERQRNALAAELIKAGK